MVTLAGKCDQMSSGSNAFLGERIFAFAFLPRPNLVEVNLSTCYVCLTL